MREIGELKLIASDLDGTALNNDQELSFLTCQTLNELMDQGVKVLLATGRSFKNTQPVFRATSLNLTNPNLYLAGLNGAEIKHVATDKIIARQAISSDVATSFYNDLISNAEKRGGKFFIIAFAYHHNHPDKMYILVNDYVRQTRFLHQHVRSFQMMKKHGLLVDVVVDLLQDIEQYQILKYFVCMEPEYLKPIVDEWSNGLTMSYQVAEHDARFYVSEVTAPAVNKAFAIQTICNQFDIDPCQQVIAFGNESNDLPMFKIVKQGIALKNASDVVKEQATMITERDNHHDGVAHWLNNNLQLHNNR